MQLGDTILATNSWMGGLLQIIDLLIVMVIWYPFLRSLDRNTQEAL